MSDRGGLDVGSAHGEIVVGSDLKGVDQATKALGLFNQKTKSTEQALSTLTKTGAVIGAGIVAGLGASINTFRGVETELLALKAVSGATEDQFKQLEDLALQIGKDTTFSSQQAAQALTDLARAGVKIPDILSGAAEGAVALAGAAGEGIPEAAKQISTALNQFGLGGDQATRVADIFTNAANQSAASADSLGQALTYVGATAHALNIPIEDVVAAVAVLADQGVDGSVAGTSLAAALSALVSPSKEAAAMQKRIGLQVQDNAGNFVGLASIIDQLAKATAGLGDVERQNLIETLIPESRAARAINLLLATQTEEAKAAGRSWGDYADAMRETGSAEEQQKIRLSGIDGALQDLSGSLEVARFRLGAGLAPAVETVAIAIGGAADAFSGLDAGTQKVIGSTLALVAGVALLGAGLAKGISLGKDIIGAYSTIAKSLTGAGAAAEASAAGTETAAAAETAKAAAATEMAVAEEAATAALGEEAVAAEVATVATGEVAVAEGAAATAAGTMAVATEGAAAATGGFSAAAAGLAIVLGELIAIGGAIVLTYDGIKHTLEGGTALFDRLASGIGHGLAFSLDKVGADELSDKLNATIDEGMADLDVQDRAIELGFHVDTAGIKNAGDAVIKEIGITVEEAQRQADEANLTIDQYLANYADVLGLTKEVTDAKHKDAEQTDKQTTATEDQASAQAEANVVAGQSVEELQSQADAEEKAAEDAAKLAEKIGDIVTGALVANGTLRDLGDGVIVADRGLTRLTDTTAGAVLQFDKFGNIRLTKSNREALELERTLEHVESRLAQVDAEVANNEEDMGMWQGRISLVTDVLGGNTDKLGELIEQLQNGTTTQEQFDAAIDAGALGPFEKLDALYAQGKIGLDQYNAAKEAGIHLLKRSAGGIQDEDAELVQNIIDLDRYVTEHDDAAGAVNRLTDAQREFLAATKSDAVQGFIDDLVKLKAIDAPEEVITKFIVDSSQADPLIAAFVEDTRLLDGQEVSVALTAENANRVLDDLGGIATFAVGLDGKTVTVSVETDAQALRFAEENADALDGKEVTFVIRGDDGPVTKTLAELQGRDQPPIIQGVRFDLQGPPGVADLFAQGKLGNPSLAAIAEQLAPAPIPITAEDKTREGVDSAKTNIGTVSDAAGPEGEETGQAFADGLSNKRAEVTGAADGLRAAMNAAFQAAVDAAAAWGNATGANYAVSFVNAVNGLGQAAYNAGFNLGFNADVGAQAGIQAHSPSRAAIATAHNYAFTFIDTLRDEAAAARAAGALFAGAATQGADSAVGNAALSFQGAITGLRAQMGSAVGAFDAFMSHVFTDGDWLNDALTGVPASLKGSVQNLGKTIADTLEGSDGLVHGAAYRLGQVIVSGTESALGIGSPSRAAIATAKNYGETFVDTLLALANEAEAAGHTFTAAALRGAQGQAGSLTSGFGSAIAALRAQMGDAAGAFDRYVASVASGGDALNDWLTHLPARYHDQALALGRSIASGVQGGFAGAMGIGSPSTVFVGYGANLAASLLAGTERLAPGAAFGRQFIDDVGNQTAAAHQAGFSLAAAAALGAKGGFSDLATRAVFGGDALAFTPNVGRAGAAGGGIALNVGGISVVVNGASADADAIANRVRTEVVDGIGQLISRRT